MELLEGLYLLGVMILVPFAMFEEIENVTKEDSNKESEG